MVSLLVVVRHNAREPKYRCLSCREWVGYEGEEKAYETHVVACAARRDAELRGASLRVRMPGIFDPNASGDVELERWYRANRGLLLEGRRKL